MLVPTPLRRLAAALPAVLAVAFAACSTTTYPNSIFTSATEFNREVGSLFNILIWLGTIVFIFVEGILLYAIWRFRRKNDDDRPEHVHGNTTLEILWTAIPALILAFIAVPTVQTIFKTQAKANASALQVQVIGHQWWWEFRYPQYNFVTANELYLPVGRTVNFSLKSADVLHSFSIPRLGGKRDLITNHENFLWFTPDSVGEAAFNGMCAEYCGASHANMRFKVFTVAPADFEAWTQHQQSVAAFGAVAPTQPTVIAPPPGSPASAAKLGEMITAQSRATGGLPTPAVTPPGMSPGTAPTGAPAMAAAGSNPAMSMPGHDMSKMTPPIRSDFVSFPHDKLPDYVVPKTPIPGGLTWNESITGDAERGRAFVSTGGGACVGCHTISGNPVMAGVIGPNLTHIATRTTIAAGLYPNDTKHLALWIKNARYLKPGVLMPTLGAFQRDPFTKKTIPQTGLSDQQIADIVAYLQALK